MNVELKKNVLGEFIGTFLFVFFGCGSVAAAVAYGAFSGVVQVAAIWGLGLALAIYVGGALGGGHYNPAVTLAFAFHRKFCWCKVLPYILTQVTAAFFASCILYVIFSGAISNYESHNGMVKGAVGSEATAGIFGEYFPNPAGKSLTEESAQLVSHGSAFFAEVIGTAIFVIVIFSVTDPRNKLASSTAAPILIGATLAALISLIGPITGGCFNPARDFGPRLFSSVAGWGQVAFQTNGWGWLTVYILAPVMGAWLGGRAYTLLLKPSYDSI